MTTLSLDPWRVRFVGADLALGLVGLAFVMLALFSATSADPATVNDRGLAASLPLGFWWGLVGLNLTFVLAIGRSATRTWVPGALLAGLVVLLYGVAHAVSGFPRNAVAWRHIGIAEALAESGVDPHIDIYFNWPGFFAGLATFVEATGLSSLQIALWAPLVNIALWSVAVLAVLRVFTRDRTRLLMALWLFLIGNWIDQDYLSPQAFGLMLYLVVVALVLALLGAIRTDEDNARAWWSRAAQRPANPDARQRTLALGAALLLCAAVVASHQLTPVMVIVSLGALALLRRSWAPWLPVVVGVLLVLWLAYPASTYLAGHPPFGAESSGVVTANVTERLAGSLGHVYVQRVRMALTAALWGLALVGFLRDRRAGLVDLRLVALAAAPFLVLPTQSYGGEMLLRVTLFALPFVAFLAARALMPARPGQSLSAARGVGIVVVCSALAVASVTARYGNARFDIFTPAEVEAVGQLARLAPEGSVLVAGAPSTPWGAEDYVEYKRRSLQGVCAADFGPTSCRASLEGLAFHEGEQGLYLLLTRGNEASLRMKGQMSSAEFRELEHGLATLSGAELLFANRDARIYHLDLTHGRPS